jgi:aryl-alcohol dehydrogenase-like predicted oxidoreductase
MQTMRHRALGGSQVGAIGVGEVSPAIAAKRGVDGIDRIVAEAIERGLDIVDAAEDGELVVGAAIRSLHARDRVIVVTHIPALAEKPGFGRDIVHDRLPSDYVRERVYASLRATKLEALPLAMVPVAGAWRESRAWHELVDTCARLVYEGNVQRWGATLLDPADPVLEPWLAAVEVRFSACAREAATTITAAFEAKLAVLAREPLAGGALAGDLGPGRAFKPTDDRRDIDLERVAIGVAKLARLVQVAPPAARSSALAKQAFETTPLAEIRDCATVAELALRYVIDRGVIAMPRLHRREHIADALRFGAAEPLPADLVERIESTI